MPIGSTFYHGNYYQVYSATVENGCFNSCLFRIGVRVMECPLIPPINYGYTKYTANLLYGSKASFQCNSNFDQKPPNTKRECNQAGFWDGLPPTCSAPPCPNIAQSIPHGGVTCTDGMAYMTVCTYTCDGGYGVKHGNARQRVCVENSEWSAPQPHCLDTEPPEILECPSDLVLYPGPLQSTTPGTWADPTAIDNHDPTVQVTQTEGPLPGDLLGPGYYHIQYDVADLAGNQAVPCALEITVLLLSCQPLYPMARQVMTCEEGFLYGSNCSFSCQGHFVLNTTDTVETYSCDLTGSEDQPEVQWNAGSSYTQPICEAPSFEPFPLSDNSEVKCDLWMFGMFCYDECLPGYEIAAIAGGSTPMHVQGEKGRWEPEEVTQCTESAPANSHYMFVKYSFGSYVCCDAEAVRFVESILNSNEATSACSGYCHSEEVIVDCSSCSEAPHDSNLTESNSTVVTAILLTLSDVGTSYEDASKDLDAYFQITLTLLPSDPGTLTSSAASVVKSVCTNSTTISSSGKLCVVCAKGTCEIDGKCLPCPVGTYQPSEKARTCIACSHGSSTLHPGSYNSSHCIELCPFGSYSASGRLPCSLCPRGAFSDTLGATWCDPCPANQWTAEQGSRSINCSAFELALTRNLTLTRHDMTTASPLALTLKINMHQLNESVEILRVRLDFVDHDPHFITIEVDGTDATVKSGSCAVLVSIASSTSTWTALTVAVKNETLQVFNEALPIGKVECIQEIPGEGLGNTTLILGSEDQRSLAPKVTLADVYYFTNDQPLDELLATCSECGFLPPHVPMIAWSDLAAAAESSGQGITLTRTCTDNNHCSSGPCGPYSTCSESVGGFHCTCAAGLTGDECSQGMDDCVDNGCVSGATCVDGMDSYTCQCPPEYSGPYCQKLKVDGGWSVWGPWSICSASCDGGLHVRHRLCNEPQPANGGLPCQGIGQQEETCNNHTCPVCPELATSANSSVRCNLQLGSSDSLNCSLICDIGYTFDYEPLPYYLCGNMTDYRWSFANAENPNFTLPSCSPATAAQDMEVSTVYAYPDMPCEPGIMAKLNQTILENVHQMPCINSGDCWVLSVQVACGISLNDTAALRSPRYPPEPGVSAVFTIFVNTSAIDMEGAYDRAEILFASADLINNMTEAGQFTVQAGGASYGANKTGTIGTFTCGPGQTQVSLACVPCGPGTREVGAECVRCPRGMYQEKSEQTTCLPCPKGYTTPGTGAANFTFCRAICGPGTHLDKGTGMCIPDRAIMIVILVLFSILIMLVTILLIWKWKATSKRRIHPEPPEYSEHDTAAQITPYVFVLDQKQELRMENSVQSGQVAMAKLKGTGEDIEHRGFHGSDIDADEQIEGGGFSGEAEEASKVKGDHDDAWHAWSELLKTRRSGPPHRPREKRPGLPKVQ